MIKKVKFFFKIEISHQFQFSCGVGGEQRKERKYH